MILITGAGGLLGGYLTQQFSDEKIVTLGRREDADFRVDLSKELPDFGEEKFEAVVHSAGSEDDSLAMDLNYEGTKRLLQAL